MCIRCVLTTLYNVFAFNFGKSEKCIGIVNLNTWNRIRQLK